MVEYKSRLIGLKNNLNGDDELHQFMYFFQCCSQNRGHSSIINLLIVYHLTGIEINGDAIVRNNAILFCIIMSEESI